jgi:hypothetical protein
MGLFLSVCYRCSANKVRRQTSELNARLGVEIYFIFDLRASYQCQNKNSKTNRQWNYIALVDGDKVFLIDAVGLNELRILDFWDKVTNFGFVFRQVDSDNLMLGCIQVGLDIQQ